MYRQSAGVHLLFLLPAGEGQGEGERKHWIMATNQTVSVVTNASDIRDIKPPVEIPSGWEWLWWTLAIFALAAALYAAWRYWRKRQSQVPVVPPVPAHIRAKQKLQAALALIGQPKPFCILVSDTLRQYLEERFEFRAPERTTEEFLHELRSTDRLTRDQKDSLGDFLQRCDLVKFARFEPNEPELRDLHGAALRLVEETEPLEAKAAGGNSESRNDSDMEIVNRKS